MSAETTCRECGCTGDDCARCVARGGSPCWWVEPGLCSACSPARPLLVVGEQPNAATEGRPDRWLRPDRSGIRHAGNRLLEYSGFDRALFLAAFDRTNLLHHAGRWSIPAARRAAAELLDREERRAASRPDRRFALVLLGRRVREAFGHEHALPFTVVRPRVFGGPRLIPMPHPSGRCRAWNAAGTRERARRLFLQLRAVAEATTLGSRELAGAAE